MKRKILIAIMAFMAIIVHAQSQQAETSNVSNDVKNIIYKTVPKKFRLKDNIIVRNMSPYYILQIVVAYPKADGELDPLGSGTYIAPNEEYGLASFSKNSLKRLRGMTIAIKAKGAKVLMGEQNKTNVWTPLGPVGVKHKELSAEIINNIKPEDITYSFDVKLYESRHDLYIELYNTGENGGGVMDF